MFKLSFSDIRHRHTSAPRRAVLVGLQLPEHTERAVQASLAELEQLVSGLGITVTAHVVQRRSGPGAPGSGKLREIAALTVAKSPVGRELTEAPIDHLVPLSDPAHAERDSDPEEAAATPDTRLADLVIVDTELGPADTRHMELELGVEVMDRPGVILRVFEQRAQTREARLETQIARLAYEAPRVRDRGTNDDRQGGGGRGGRGHTNVELAKREIRERMRSLRRELDTLYAAQTARREKRRETFGVALVGYTNAGKSTWMRALTGSDVLIEDQLFATLGTTVRALNPDATPSILVSDTVGFIRNLPHSLIASFRATLDEARHASLLLFIADASDPELRAELTVTREVLAEIGAGDVPSIVVLNKVDRLSAGETEALAREFPEARLMSARRPADVAELRRQIIGFFEQRMVELEIEVPYAKLALVGRIHERAHVLSEHYTEAGAVLHVRALHSAAAQIERALAESSA